MKIVELNDVEVLHYCTRDEDHLFDRKAFGIKGAKIQKIAVAFANADGGEFVVGIEDANNGAAPLRRWQGQESTELYNSAIQALSELVPSIDFRFDFIKRKDEIKNYVLRVKINKGLVVHKTASNDVYIRKGAQSFPLSAPIKILELTHAKGITSEEDALVPRASIDEIEGSKYLRDFLNQLPINEPDALNFLLQENLVDKDSWVPRVAAVLLFADNPSAVLPKQCAMKIVSYDTHHEDIDRDALIVTHAIEGGLYHQITNTFKKLNEVLSSNRTWTIEGQVPTKYPVETVWEILVNSVIHRDYSISDNVLISVFCNRVEFKSPGRLPGFVTPDNILDNRFSRNSKLVRLLSKYQEAPNKELGEGMNTAFQKMRDAGLRPPEVIEDGNYVKVIIRHASALEPEQVVIRFLEKHNLISNRQALDLAGLETSEKVTALFAKMKDKGMIQRVESTSGVGSRWEIRR